MNEILKTVLFVVAAAVVALIAWMSNPSLPAPGAQDMLNQLLYPDFKDPRSAASLKIIKYDERRGEPTVFEVAQVERKGVVRWSIPSHNDYPADAKEQMSSAAVALMGLKVIEVVGDDESAQETYGVVAPEVKTLKAGVTGVGDEVTMKDKAGKELLALVIGKEVPDRPNLRYVRKVGGSEIYVVEAKTDKLSTKFEDWIEPNLLKISTIDLKQVGIRDYSIRETTRGLAIMHRDRMQLAYNDAGEPHWKMLTDEKFGGDDPKNPAGKWRPIAMTADEELNTAKLDELRTALDDLKIIDVSQKPAGLRGDLKVGRDFTSNEAAVASLEDKGFFPAQIDANSTPELFSNEGEIRLAMKDGVEYVLRFGQIAGSGPSAKDSKKDAKKKGKDAGKEKDKQGGGVNRYLLVMVEFDQNAIPKPQFEKLPEPGKAKEPEKKADDKAAKDAKAADKKPDGKKRDDKAAKDKQPETKADEKQAVPDKKAEEAERARIEKENKRKQEEYDRQVADGKKKMAELNGRFADWYYVISDEVYRKIHLSRDEIIKKKPKKEPEKAGKAAVPGQPGGAKPVVTPIDELEKLKSEGPGGK
jgi:hypothetical protein